MPHSPPPAAWRLRPFALADVSLSSRLFADKRGLMLDCVRGCWTGLDGEANGNLRGHYSGHFLSMLSQAYASTGEQAFADKIPTMVGALVECRQALNPPPSALGVQGRFPQLRLIDASARVTPHTRPSRTRHREITCTVR